MMSAFIIWVVGMAILGAFALYWYGRSNSDLQYEMEDSGGAIAFLIVTWPLTIPLAAVGFVLYKIGRFFYDLGERHKNKNKEDDV
jgi:hypothetical protein